MARSKKQPAKPKPRLGRPPREGGAMVNLVVRIDPGMKADLDLMARGRGESTPWLVRSILEDWFAGV